MGLPNFEISSLLSKISILKGKLNTIMRADKPRLPPDSTIIKISRILDLNRSKVQQETLDSYNNKITIYNGAMVLNYVLKKLESQSKLFETHPILVPSKLNKPMLPLPPRLFSTLTARHGSLTPSWLTIPNLRCQSTAALNQHFNDLITPPIVPVTATSTLYTANKMKDHPDLLNICPGIHPIQVLIPEHFHDYLLHPEVTGNPSLHVTYLCPEQSVPLIMTN